MNKQTVWQGSLDLVYVKRDNQTLMSHHLQQAPLKIQRSFYPEGKEVCHSVLLHTAGGMVGGDRLSVNVDLQSDTRVLITTANASKVYRSNGLTTQQTTVINIQTGAVLEWLPQPNIIFDGALYRQDYRVNLDPGANWLACDVTMFGRQAKGEKFISGHWRSHVEVWQNDQPLWIDRQYLAGGEKMLNSPLALGGNAVVANLVYLGQVISPAMVTDLRNLWQISPEDSAATVGITILPQGLLCRYRGQSTLEAKQWLIKVWHYLRLFYLERPSCIPGVW